MEGTREVFWHAMRQDGTVWTCEWSSAVQAGRPVAISSVRCPPAGPRRYTRAVESYAEESGEREPLFQGARAPRWRRPMRMPLIDLSPMNHAILTASWRVEEDHKDTLAPTRQWSKKPCNTHRSR